MAEKPDFIRSSSLTRLRTAPNPGPFTLEGTNSFIIGGQSGTVIVDPGPLDLPHLRLLAAAGPVGLVLITHRHPDHTAASEEFRRMTGAPVRAMDPAFCHGAAPLEDGEEFVAGGIRIVVVATPGHTSDSVSFHLPDDGPTGSVLTGDTILGRGTTVISPPDGALGGYLESIARLHGLGAATVLPGHGPVLPDLAATCEVYLAHRHRRLDEVRAAVATLGEAASVAAVTAIVYSTIDPLLRHGAELSVAVQLDYLNSKSA